MGIDQNLYLLLDIMFRAADAILQHILEYSILFGVYMWITGPFHVYNLLVQFSYECRHLLIKQTLLLQMCLCVSPWPPLVRFWQLLHCVETHCKYHE